MANEWGSVPLAELTATPATYGVVQPGQDTPDGVPMVRVNNFQGNSLNFAEVMHIAPEIEAKYERTRIQAGDVLITIVGSVGQVAIVSNELSGWNIARAVAMIRPKAPELSRWISLVLRSPQAQHQLGVAANTTVQTTINLKDLRQLQIPLPREYERHTIAHILGTLDDKIELNRRMNETLEAMARALFKAWFVDFEPVRAKLEGRWRRGQSLPGLPAHLYDLFPDRLVESELGEIPEGWRIEPLSDSIDFKEGPGIRNWQYTNSDDGVKFINIRCIQNGDLYLDTANRITEKEASGKYAHFNLQPWDIVVSTSGTLGRSAIVRTEHLPLVLNTSVIRFRPIDKKTSFSYVYQYLNHTEFLEKLETMASGSVQRNFGPVHLKQIVILLPSFDVMQAYEDICRPTYEQIVNYRIQSSSLARLRDTLLPKLISGELRVSDAETFMARVEHGATTNHTRRAS